MELLHALLALLILIAITVVPVMIAARWARARRRGFLHALAAVVLATLVVHLAMYFIDNALLALVIVFVGGCAVYALVLGTSFVAAVGIAVIATILQLLIIAALLWLGLQIPFAVTLPLAV